MVVLEKRLMHITNKKKEPQLRFLLMQVETYYLVITTSRNTFITFS